MQAVTRSETPGQTWLHFARGIVREGGARAFFMGMRPTLVRAYLMDAAAFVAYTNSLRVLSAL